jgi:hypothetical protein
MPDMADQKGELLLKALKNKFEGLFPHIELNLNIPKFDVYDVEEVEKKLSDDTYDIMELDAIIAHEIFKKGVLSELHPSSLDLFNLFESSKKAATDHAGSVIGIPHLLCGYFIFSYATELKNIENEKSFLSLLEDMERQHQKFFGNNMYGLYTLPTLYLDLWQDKYPNEDMMSEVHNIVSNKKYDTTIIYQLKSLFSFCKVGIDNPCKDSEYVDEAGKLANGEVDFILGYSETLNSIIFIYQFYHARRNL